MADGTDKHERDPAEETQPVVDFRNLNTASSLKPSAKGASAAEGPGRLTIPEQKESAARRVALIITWTFAFASVAILVGAYRILRWQPTEAKSLLVDAAAPLLEKSGIFLSSTFGPLLAFVLGYYFGEKARGSDK